jgi:peptidyl-dipeptidase Dcp
MIANPFFEPSALPFGLPPFDEIDASHYRPAFAAGMSAQRAEVGAIAGAASAPDFDNTVVALERSGRLLERVSTTFFNLNAADTNPEMQRIEIELVPQLTAHEDSILLDGALYARVAAVYERSTELGLDGESRELLERWHTQFVRAGARLADPDKARLRALNERISSLTTRFKQNVLKATTDGAVLIESETELRGLSEVEVGAAAAAAAARGLEGKWLIALQNTTSQPALGELEDRGVRERIYRASIGRNRGGDADNTGVVAELVRLRAERAVLLGYSSHAAYELADESAGTPQAVGALLGQLAPAALAKAKKDASDLQRLIDAEASSAGRAPFALQAWDWPYYARLLRKARHDFDRSEVAPYFELDRVLRDGVFHAAHRLYGLTFTECTDLPRYHPDVRVFEVFDSDGARLALFLTDYYARDSKQGGAWMTSYVRQSRLLGMRPVVANHLNIPKPKPGEPTLLTFDEVTTLFHEFGHALHGMLSDVRYPLLSGTNVPRDFVEYPSQFNEMWGRDPQVLAHCARHFRTGEPMPGELLAKVLAAQRFDQGYAATEYLAAALVDQAWHAIGAGQAPAPAAVLDFEAAALRAHGMDYPPVPPRYHSTYFSHIFAGGYASGYYAYIWSEVLARDTGDWLQAHGGLTRSNGERLRSTVLSRGRSEDPQTQFRNFYGGPPEIGPLLAYRGLELT